MVKGEAFFWEVKVRLEAVFSGMRMAGRATLGAAEAMVARREATRREEAIAMELRLNWLAGRGERRRLWEEIEMGWERELFWEEKAGGRARVNSSGGLPGDKYCPAKFSPFRGPVRPSALLSADPLGRLHVNRFGRRFAGFLCSWAGSEVAGIYYYIIYDLKMEIIEIDNNNYSSRSKNQECIYITIYIYIYIEYICPRV